MYEFEAIQAFRAAERYVGKPLVCCLCGCEAQGNANDNECGEPLCDACFDDCVGDHDNDFE